MLEGVRKLSIGCLKASASDTVAGIRFLVLSQSRKERAFQCIFAESLNERPGLLGLWQKDCSTFPLHRK